jgi:hypothetical protein
MFNYLLSSLSPPALAASLSTALAALLILLHLYRAHIRPMFPATVECWFCNRKNKVEYRKKVIFCSPNLHCDQLAMDGLFQNSFFCVFTECGQYNGFDKDGDYNWQDPNKSVGEGDVCAVSSGQYNGLCQNCNLNQTLKMRQFAQFEPVNADREDEEMDRYRKHLERAYKLCRKCKCDN